MEEDKNRTLEETIWANLQTGLDAINEAATGPENQSVLVSKAQSFLSAAHVQSNLAIVTYYRLYTKGVIESNLAIADAMNRLASAIQTFNK